MDTQFYSKVDGVSVYDSFPEEEFPSDLEIQIARVYGETSNTIESILINMASVQEQIGSMNSGVFALAFAYHSANGDTVSTFNFDEEKMRGHLLTCLAKNLFSPFPKRKNVVTIYPYRNSLLLRLYCICLMPECYDKSMVCCDECESWYHFKCVGITCACSPSAASDECTCAPAIWICSSCES